MAAPVTLLAETAADLMTANPVSLESTTTAAEAARVLTTKGYGAAAVTDHAGRPIGVVTKTDLLVHARGRGMVEDTTPIADVMTTAVFSVRTDTPARSVITQLLALHVHHLFVMDSSGVLVGVISPLDVLQKLS